MASIGGYADCIIGTTGSTNVLEPKSTHYVYVLPRGAHASTASTGTVITLDSAAAAARFTANHWVQVGLNGSNVRQITGVGGNSIGVNSAVTVAASDRIYLIGATQPTISGASATYVPNTAIFPRDDDGATQVVNSLLTTDSNGLFQFWSANGYYDAILQDTNRTNIGSIIDINIGQITAPLVPTTGRVDDIGSAALPWDDITLSGRIISAVTSSSGVTYHRFTTTAGITGGAIFQFDNNGGAPLIYGDTWGGILQSYTLPQVHNVKSAKYGAKGDGTTDDTAAITAAIAAAFVTGAAGEGGVVFFPPGVYIVSSTITLKDRCRIVGSGKRSTYIRAKATFAFNGTTDAVIQLGTATNTFDCRVEHVTVDCNNIAGSIGVYSPQIQEGSGVFHCLVVNYIVKGIYFASATQNWKIAGLELYSGTGATTAIALDCDNAGGVQTIEDVTVNSNAAAQSTNPGIRLTNGDYNLYRIHTEKHDVGVKFGSNATGSVIGLFGHASVGVNLEIAQSGVLAFDVSQVGGASAINDTVGGHSVSMNGGGWYMRSNDGAAKSVFTSTANAPSLLNSPTVFANTLTCNGQFGVTSTATFGGTASVSSIQASSIPTATCGTVTTLPAGFIIGLSSSPAGSTTVTTLTASGQRFVVLLGKAGTVTLAEGGNIHTAASVSTAIGVSDSVIAFCDGFSWYTYPLLDT